MTTGKVNEEEGDTTEETEGGVKSFAERGYVRAQQYIQSAEILPGLDGRTVARILYFKCQKMGHFPDLCPEILEADQLPIDTYKILIKENGLVN